MGIIKGATVPGVVDRVVIRKDGFRPSSPWSADLYFKSGELWVSWCYGYRTKKGLIEYIEAVNSDLDIVRGPYKYSIDTDMERMPY